MATSRPVDERERLPTYLASLDAQAKVAMSAAQAARRRVERMTLTEFTVAAGAHQAFQSYCALLRDKLRLIGGPEAAVVLDYVRKLELRVVREGLRTMRAYLERLRALNIALLGGREVLELERWHLGRTVAALGEPDPASAGPIVEAREIEALLAEMVERMPAMPDLSRPEAPARRRRSAEEAAWAVWAA